MTRGEIEDIIKEAMAREFELEPEALVPQARIRDDLGLDSLDIVDMVIVLEAAFGFAIRDKAPLLNIQTLGDVATFVEGVAAGLEREKAGSGE